jgi:hypothetical protein
MSGVGVEVEVGGNVGSGVGVLVGTRVGVAVPVGVGGGEVGVSSISTNGVGLVGSGAGDSAAHPAKKRINSIVKNTNFCCCIIPHKSCYKKQTEESLS